MKKLSQNISSIIDDLGEDISLVKKAYRAAQVRSMWEELVEPIFLEHTNSIYIITEEDEKTLIVYVDDSIFAAELNARRELIKLKFLQQFNENIDEFKICISRGSYKKNYPFKKNENIQTNKKKHRPLTEKEREKIETIVACIEDEKIKENLKKAMIADWEFKKEK